MDGLQTNFTIKELPAEERPREKLLKKGSRYLSNAELLALIIRTGNKNRTAVELAQDLLNFHGGLEGIQDLSCEEFKSINGIGTAKAAQIRAVIELSQRISKLKNSKRDLVSNPIQ